MRLKFYLNEEKIIPGFNEKYIATRKGDIYSLKGLKKKMVGKITEKGYKEITISHKNKNQHFLVHKIIAELFIGKRKKGQKINHKDGNKLNNAVNNLEYVTNQENIEHARDTGLLKSIKLNKEDIKKIREEIKLKSTKELAKKYNVSPSTINKIINNKRWRIK